MNTTLTNTTEEAFIHVILIGTTLFVHCYSICLLYAMYDYEDEKPDSEKELVDIHLKDCIQSQLYFLYYHGFIQFISLVTPPLTFDLVYQLSHLNVFFIHFSAASCFVYLYVLYEHTFHFDAVKNIPTSRMRWICFVLKLLLTIIAVFVSIVIPLEIQPVGFQMLTKGKTYDG